MTKSFFGWYLIGSLYLQSVKAWLLTLIRKDLTPQRRFGLRSNKGYFLQPPKPL